jgi:hypothetical protein
MLIFINKKEKNLPDLYSEKGVKKKKRKEKKRKEKKRKEKN